MSMCLKKLELSGFKSFAKKAELTFETPITAIVGPNGSGKSNVAEAFRWSLGEQSLKSLRGRRGEDLIFNGSHNLGRMGRANVTLTFHNDKKIFDIDFRDVSVTREVYRDGTNNYLLNGSSVRLRDIIELLSQVSLGASSHHIISQGESDRILAASLKDRKGMIEDALGLRVYHWKIGEALKKLDKTRENIKEAQSARREIAGHFRFLKKEAEKIERSKEFREELYKFYKDYLLDEKFTIEKRIEELKKGKEEQGTELERLTIDLGELDSARKKDGVEKDDEFSWLDKKIDELRKSKDLNARNLGRLEGILEFKETELGASREELSSRTYNGIEVENFLVKIEETIEDMNDKNDVVQIKERLLNLSKILDEFRKSDGDRDKENKINEELKKLKLEKEELLDGVAKIDKELEDILGERESLKNAIENRAKELMEMEREYFETKEKKIVSEINMKRLDRDLHELNVRHDRYKNDLYGSLHLLGREKYEILQVEIEGNRNGSFALENKQEGRRKEIERLKIRIEELGPASESVMREYEEIKERDAFLDREIEDLEDGAKLLNGLINDLEGKLDIEFKAGVAKINGEFQNFFELMFGGGKASLRLSKIKKREIDEVIGSEEDEVDEGIEIYVNLPRKKIHGLEMLSGGERALTSIALLFAMTQVKPPPFLLLDETDAALDEANSRKYGDMLENLSKHTQLILITHNRETMSRAGILYGVTMGSDGVSKLLSVKFDEAVKIAK